MPIYLRRFYLRRLDKQYNDEAKQLKKEQQKVQRSLPRIKK
jgi:hypothetical protein